MWLPQGILDQIGLSGTPENLIATVFSARSGKLQTCSVEEDCCHRSLVSLKQSLPRLQEPGALNVFDL